MSGPWAWRQAGSQERPYTQLLRDGEVAGELAFIIPHHSPWPALLNDQIVKLLDRHNDISKEWEASDLATEIRHLDREATEL